MVRRRHFIRAYRGALELELKKINSRFFKVNDGDVEESVLYSELAELHADLSVAEVISYRNFVVTALHSQGETILALKGAVKTSTEKSIKYYNLPQPPPGPNPYPPSSIHTHTPSSSTSTSRASTPTRSDPLTGLPSIRIVTGKKSDRDSDVHLDDFDADSGSHSNSNKHETLSVTMTVRVSRFAVTVLEEIGLNQSLSPPTTLYPRSMSYETENIQAPTAENVRSVLSIVVYGTDITARTTGDYDKALSVRVGSVRTYGLLGVELFSCGCDPHTWMDEGDRAGGRAAGPWGRECAADLSVLLGAAVPTSTSTSTSRGPIQSSSLLLSSGGRKDTRGVLGEERDKEWEEEEWDDVTASLPLPPRSKIPLKKLQYSSKKEGSQDSPVVVTLTLSLLTCSWDADTLHLLRTLSDQLTHTLASSCPFDQMPVQIPHPYTALRLKAASLSLFKLESTTVDTNRYVDTVF